MTTAHEGWRRKGNLNSEFCGDPNYIVLYRETPTLVEVVNVFHARQQWPK